GANRIRMRPNRLGAACLTLAMPMIAAGAAAAQVGPGAGAGGGTIAPGDPQVTSIQCVTRCIGPSTGVVKSRIRLLGSDLGGVTKVSMARADGTRVKDMNPVVKPSGVVMSRIGKGAVSGPVRVI